jgi:hypothetical protein
MAMKEYLRGERSDSCTNKELADLRDERLNVYTNVDGLYQLVGVDIDRETDVFRRALQEHTEDSILIRAAND